MTLGDAKRRVLMLLDEYSTDGVVRADADISARMNDFFDMAQRDIVAWQPIVRRTSVTLDGSGEQALPDDVQRVFAIMRDGRRVAGFEVVDGKLVYKPGDTASVTLDYLASPCAITPETPDSYAFEVSDEAANCLPYFVAAQQLVADLVVDYGAFYNLYLQLRALLPRTGRGASKPLRQALYRG